MGDCPKDVVVPVIFVPGIMGSPLQNNSGEIVWSPDSKILSGRNYVWNSGSVVGPDLFRIRERANVTDAATKRKNLLIGGSTFEKDHLKPLEYAKHKKISDTSAGF